MNKKNIQKLEKIIEIEKEISILRKEKNRLYDAVYMSEYREKQKKSSDNM